jgi:hypothetical protein
MDNMDIDSDGINLAVWKSDGHDPARKKYSNIHTKCNGFDNQHGSRMVHESDLFNISCHNDICSPKRSGGGGVVKSEDVGV